MTMAEIGLGVETPRPADSSPVAPALFTQGQRRGFGRTFVGLLGMLSGDPTPLMYSTQTDIHSRSSIKAKSAYRFTHANVIVDTVDDRVL
jgi:hypothetical protein